jgi:hypothetical protein
MMSENEFETNDYLDELAEDQNAEVHPQPARRPEELDIRDLRKLATSYGIRAQRTWVREDFITAINNRRNSNESLVDVVYDDSRNPAPGHARITIQSPEMGSTLPIPVAVNNYVCRIPRDVTVDIPIEVMEALNNSKTPVRVKDPKGGVDQQGNPKLVWRDVLSYPFQVHAMTPGTARYPNGMLKIKPSANPAKHSLKLKYREIYKRWPKREQLRKFEEMHMERMAEKAFNTEDVALAKKSKERT